MQKIIIIAILFALAYSAQVDVSPGTATGFAVIMGVAHKCHQTCKTCKGGLITDCLTCHASTILLATAGTCGCTNASTDRLSALAGALLCEDNTQGTSNGGTATLALCAAAADGFGAGNLYYVSGDKACAYCPDNMKTCTGATTATTVCWATQALSSTACTYTAAKSYVSGLDTVYIQTSIALSIVNGYWYDSTTHQQKPCNAGCLTCDLSSTDVKCSTCATGFTPVGTAKTACECSSTGFFSTAAAADSLGACTACATGCVTCTSATVCSACDSSHTLGSTASSSECIANTTSDSSSSSSSTDGEKDGESSAATGTDATTTNGVLITAVSMLLAVILA